jgi:hypothetical protein
MDCAGDPDSIGWKMFADIGRNGEVGPGESGVSAGHNGLADCVAPGPWMGSSVNPPPEGSPVRIL